MSIPDRLSAIYARVAITEDARKVANLAKCVRMLPPVSVAALAISYISLMVWLNLPDLAYASATPSRSPAKRLTNGVSHQPAKLVHKEIANDASASGNQRVF